MGGGKGGGEGVGDEEAVVEEGAFEYEVDERVEGVPDEEDAGFDCGGSREESGRGEVGAHEEGEEE